MNYTEGVGEPSDLPEEIALLDSNPAIEAFRALNPRQRIFVLSYIRNPVGSEAYRQAYNEMADDHTASVCGSRLLANAGIKAVLTAFRDHQEEDFSLIRKALIDALTGAIKPIYGKDSAGQPEKVEDLPDHDARIKAAAALAKLQGLNAAEKTELTGANGGPIIVQASPLDEAL